MIAYITASVNKHRIPTRLFSIVAESSWGVLVVLQYRRLRKYLKSVAILYPMVTYIGLAFAVRTRPLKLHSLNQQFLVAKPKASTLWYSELATWRVRLTWHIIDVILMQYIGNFATKCLKLQVSTPPFLSRLLPIAVESNFGVMIPRRHYIG